MYTREQRYTDDYIVRMINVLLDNILSKLVGKVFHHIIAISAEPNCAQFLYSCEA